MSELSYFAEEGDLISFYALSSMWEEEGHQIIYIKQPWPVPKPGAGAVQAGPCEATITAEIGIGVVAHLSA